MVDVLLLYMIWYHNSPSVPHVVLSPYIQALLAIFSISGLLVPLVYFKGTIRKGLLAISLSIASILVILIMAAPLATRISAKGAALAILETMPETTEVISYGHYFQDLPVYLGRTVGVYGWRGELTFGQDLEPQSNSRITDSLLYAKWHGSQPVCLVAKSPDIPTSLSEKNPYIVSSAYQCYAICNQPPRDI